MKIFKKIKIDKTLISRTVLQVIDRKKADFSVIFFVKHDLVALEGKESPNLHSTGVRRIIYETEAFDMKKPKNWVKLYLTPPGRQNNVILKFLRDNPNNFNFLSN